MLSNIVLHSCRVSLEGVPRAFVGQQHRGVEESREQSGRVHRNNSFWVPVYWTTPQRRRWEGAASSAAAKEARTARAGRAGKAGENVTFPFEDLFWLQYPPRVKALGEGPQTPPSRSLRSLALVFFFSFLSFPFYFYLFSLHNFRENSVFFSSFRFPFLFSLCLNFKKIWPYKKSPKNYIYFMRPCATQNFDFFFAFIFWKMRHFLMFCENQTSFCL